MISGSSPAGLAAARTIGATAIQYPEPTDAMEAGQRPEGIDTGIRVGIIARDTAEAAWDVAHRRFPEDRKGQVAHQLATKVSDSHWHHRLSELDKQPGSEESPYWLGPFQNYKTFCPYLVGSYGRVADELARYLELGFRAFVLDIPPSKEELDHIGVVFQRALGAVQP
jgi:alkanesulfonate monooxygenase